jgi:serine/threonine-protein kinase Chk1
MGVVLFTMLVGNTPWDEPVAETSVEFRTYAAGEVWEFQPWSRIRGQSRGELAIDDRSS